MNKNFMQRAIIISREKMQAGAGGPFAAVIVKDGKIVAEGYNQVTSTNDPTAHAEIVAIREACQKLKTFSLKGCEIYTSCEPCPMCLASIYWARVDTIYYANTRADAAAIEFDDEFLYTELSLPIEERQIKMKQCLRDDANQVFQEWQAKADKTRY